jgi:hypothetical protein
MGLICLAKKNASWRSGRPVASRSTYSTNSIADQGPAIDHDVLAGSAKASAFDASHGADISFYACYVPLYLNLPHNPQPTTGSPLPSSPSAPPP